MKVFEWGSGGSTIYFKDKAFSWISIEHDPDWYRKIKKMGGNVFLEKKENYIHSLVPSSLIIVDGILREECMMRALEEESLVICHDARRWQYLPYVQKFPWNHKVGDDLFIMASPTLSSEFSDRLLPFELRSSESTSYPWDATHGWGQSLEKAGFHL